MKHIEWCGFDYGLTLMNPQHIRTKVLLGCVFIDLELDRPGIIDQKVERYYQLKEKYGGFIKLKERGRPEIYADILENNPALIDKFNETELRLLKPASDATTALNFLKKQGKKLAVVTDQQGAGLDEIITKFFDLHGLRPFLSDIYSAGLGRICEDGTVDDRFRGLSKGDGSLYRQLAVALEEQGIRPENAVIIGDSPEKDILPAKGYGFRTILYHAVSGKRCPEADYEIDHFRQLLRIFGEQ